MRNLVTAAADVAKAHLMTPLPRRWRHVAAVGRKAEVIGPAVVGDDADILAAAAWLHDIGYAPDLVDTGLHSLDGARWLVRNHWDGRIASLVANHSCALHEAIERGIASLLIREFPQELSATADALWFVDMTTGPDGQELTVEERLAEIRQRYGPEDVVTRFWRRAEPELVAAVRRTRARLDAQPM